MARDQSGSASTAELIRAQTFITKPLGPPQSMSPAIAVPLSLWELGNLRVRVEGRSLGALD